MQKNLMRSLVVLALLAAPAACFATDPSVDTIVSAVNVTFGLVAAATITMVGFFIGVRIIKGIRK